MIKDLFKSKERDDDKGKGKKPAGSKRSDRIYQDDGRFFFKTREGINVGPFLSRSDAQYALLYFCERNEWPSDQQLQDFIEGCKLFDAANE